MDCVWALFGIRARGNQSKCTLYTRVDGAVIYWVGNCYGRRKAKQMKKKTYEAQLPIGL